MTDVQPGEQPITEPTEEYLIIEGYLDNSFLRNIQNTEFTWTFQLIGRRKVTGRVISFLWDPRGVPITLMIQSPLGKPFEIPWSSIQTITQGKGD